MAYSYMEDGDYDEFWREAVKAGETEMGLIDYILFVSRIIAKHSKMIDKFFQVVNLYLAINLIGGEIVIFRRPYPLAYKFEVNTENVIDMLNIRFGIEFSDIVTLHRRPG